MDKSQLFENLQDTIDSVSNWHNLIVMGYNNDHLGQCRGGFANAIGAFGIGDKSRVG